MSRSKRSTRNRKFSYRSLLALVARAAGLKHEDMPERGSALLATLMIITGLTLLGLGFVAITQTESAISMNQKNYTQTLQVAEAGAKQCVEWFQNPTWALAQNLVPQNRDAFKVIRFLGGTNVGRYKNSPTELLFDKPFRSANAKDRFFGTETNPDVWINYSTSNTAGAVTGVTPSRDFLTHFNRTLFNNNITLNSMDNNQGGIVTDIRIYAPPVEDGNINTSDGWNGAAQPTNGTGTVATGFVEGGTRYGVATIRVTATKYDPPCTAFPCDPPNFRVVATRTVKMTITEWPFPGPQGPVQTNANLNTSGNIQVHWGRTTASGTMTMAKTFSSVPWANAYELLHFEHGYNANHYATGQTTQVWPRTATAQQEDANNYLYELVGRSFPDPWWEMRARGNITGIGGGAATQPIPYPYAYGTDPTISQSNWFQFQNQSVYPTQQNVLFPRIDYNFWKQLAQSADDEANIYYLTHAGGTNFRDKSGYVRDARDWVDVTQNPPAGTGPKSVPGFYFFESANGLNPQNNSGGTLTPQIDFKGGSMEMKGFMYFNTSQWGTQGLGGQNEWVQMPGEPYRDVGFFEVDTGTGVFAKQDAAGAACTPDGTLAGVANCKLRGASDGVWDYQEINGNGYFDIVVSQQPATRFGAVAVPAADTYRPVLWYPGCTIGGAVPGPGCSEPHEPYLNLVYPTTPLGGLVVDWYNPASTNATLAGVARATRRPKVTDNGDPVTGTPVVCAAETAAASVIADRANCTSNAWDRDGGLVQLPNILNGVLYVEGEFHSTGNATYFGSVLSNQNAEKAGNPDIYFDERLVKGLWPPGNFGFPRVYTSSVQTDQ